MSKQYDLLIRVLIIGDSGVGKTCLLCRYVDDQFFPSYAATIGIDFKVKNLTVGGKRVRLQIWDTAGQERFETITKQYYRKAEGIVMVYDIANSASFRHCAKWLSFARQHSPKSVDVTLLGNKTDLHEWRQVPTEEASAFAEKEGFGFSEASAYASAEHLDSVFEELVERILANQADRLAQQTLDSYPSDSESDCDGALKLAGGAEGASKCSC